MYVTSHLSPSMGLMSIALVSFLMVVASANSRCNPVPTMAEVPGSDNVNYTLIQRYNVEFPAGGGRDACGPTVFKCPNSLSLILKSLKIKTKKKIIFERLKLVYMGMDVISFGGWDIPGTNDVFTYTPDTLIAGNGSIGVEVNIVISSPMEITSDETNVEVLFHCLKVEEPLIASPSVPDENATFTNLFLIYVIPIVIFFLLFMMSIIHRCNPYAMAKLKSLGGFTAMDEEEIRNHAGGGTWHDHVDEIITDLKSRGVHEKRADKEEEEMKGMVYSDNDSISNSGSDPNNATTKDSINMSNSEASQSVESGESEENSEEESDEDSDEENSEDL